MGEFKKNYQNNKNAQVNINKGNEELKVTSISELQSYSNGKVIALPSFAEGQPFNARMIRPSMLALVKQGKIPNSLMNTANTLFKDGGTGVDTDDSDMMEQIFEVIETLCEASFVAPSYEEIKNAGITLTDEQLMFVFNYSQNGVKALESFRK